AQRRLGAEPAAETLHSVLYLFYPGAGDARLHLVPGHRGICHRLRRDLRPCLALDSAADLVLGRADVRYALDGDLVRLCLRQPSGRRLPRRLAWRHRVRALRLLYADLVAL